MSSGPSTGTVGPIQSGCVPCDSTNGVITTTAPADRPRMDHPGHLSGGRALAGIEDKRRPPLAVVPVQERLRERADDDRDVRRVPPRPVVPPLHVSGMQAVLRSATVGLVAVDE